MNNICAYNFHKNKLSSFKHSHFLQKNIDLSNILQNISKLLTNKQTSYK